MLILTNRVCVLVHDGACRVLRAGDVADAPDDQAARLIGLGAAEPLDPGEPVPAVEPPVSHATTGTGLEDLSIEDLKYLQREGIIEIVEEDDDPGAG